MNERLKELCEKVAREQDSQRFLVLVQELSQVLEEYQPSKPNSPHLSDHERAAELMLPPASEGIPG